MATAAAGATGDVLAWGSGRLWIARSGGRLESLTHELSAMVAPALTAAGCWCATQRGGLAAWRRDAGGAWREALRLPFENPVHALAASADDRWVLAAHGQQLTLLDGDGRIAKNYEGHDLARRRRGEARWLAHLPQRQSFVVALPALGELWEIQLDPQAAPIHDGLVHDYRMDEAIASPGFLGVRRTPLATPLPAFAFASEAAPWVAGIDGANADRVVVVHLDVRRAVASLALPGARPAGAVLRREGGEWRWWLPTAAGIEAVDAASWRAVARLEVEGRAHALQFVGGRLWVLAASPSGPSLLLRQHERGWSAARIDIGEPIGLAVRGSTLLVAGSAAVQQHAADAARRQRWLAPPATTFAGAG